MFCPLTSIAQSNEIRVGSRFGHNSTFGAFVSPSLETIQKLCDDFSIHGGLQYNTIGNTTIEARPAYHLDFVWGELSVESILAYSKLTSVHSISTGLGASLNLEKISAKLGYYYHTFGRVDWITEPFNIYYELRAYLLQKLENWDLHIAITNCEIFDLERHYQPSFIAECHHDLSEKFKLSLGVACKPAGMFNMSADYYQTYLKCGLCYRW